MRYSTSTILLVCSRRTCPHNYVVTIEFSPPQVCDVGYIRQGFLPQRKTAIEGPVTVSAILELLKAGKEAELQDLYTNWTIDSDLRVNC